MPEPAAAIRGHWTVEVQHHVRLTTGLRRCGRPPHSTTPPATGPYSPSAAPPTSAVCDAASAHSPHAIPTSVVDNGFRPARVPAHDVEPQSEKVPGTGLEPVRPRGAARFKLAVSAFHHPGRPRDRLSGVRAYPDTSPEQRNPRPMLSYFIDA